MEKKKNQQIEEAAKKAEENFNILDVLLDEDNKDPIVLMDEKGKQLSFEQIAVIPYNDNIYAVLKPIDKIENVADDEAIVFFVQERDGMPPVLMVETDESVAMSVFDEYYNLLDEAEGSNQ